MGTLLSLRIQERFEQLTPSEQRIAAVLLEKSDDILTFSATELARFSGVSKATAARLFRSLGYKDFNEVRLQARQERNLTSPTLSMLVPVEPPSGASSVATHLVTEIANITQTFESLRSDRLADVAELLARGRSIWISGTGAQNGIARHARSLLAQIRTGVHLLSDDIELWPAELASLGAGDVLLAAVTWPWPPAVSVLVEFAATARARSIVLTDPASEAKVRRHGGVPLTCYGASAAAFVSMVSLLAHAAGQSLGTSVSRSDLIDDLRHQLRHE